MELQKSQAQLREAEGPASFSQRESVFVPCASQSCPLEAICKCPLHEGDLISQISCCFKTLSLHMYVCYSVMSSSCNPLGLWPIRLLCPWNSPGKNTGVCFHLFLQGIFPSQESNPHFLGLLNWQADSSPLSNLEAQYNNTPLDINDSLSLLAGQRERFQMRILGYS